MIKYISSSWKDKLKTDFDHEVRAYINPRGLEYGPISSAGSFTPVVSTDNVPGSYNGYQLNNTYALPFSAPKTIDILVKPDFAYNVAEYTIMSWTYGTQYVKIGYNNTNHRFFIARYTTSETRVYFGATFSSDATLKVWHRLSFVLSGTSVDAYHNLAKTTSAFVTTSLTNLPILNIGGGVDAYINNVRLFDIACTTEQVTNCYKEVSNRETFLDFNKKHCGRERCSVTANRDMFDYTIENTSTLSSASASVSLYNISGQYNDDTFKPASGLYPSDILYPSDTLYPIDDDVSFVPELGYYNGTGDQVYLQRRIGLEIETWNVYTEQDMYEPLFLGSIDPGSFSRSVSAVGISTISLTANDGIADIARRVVRKNRYWEDYYLTNEYSVSTSLFHTIAKLATEREIYNYVCNSGFENTTIGNSWSVSGGTVSRSTTQKLLGTYSAKINASSIYQNISFELSKGERFNFSAFIYSSTPMYMSVKIGELINGIYVGSSVNPKYHSGNGWELISVNHTVMNSSSNYLSCSIEPGATADVYADGCMLVYGDYKPFYVDNTNDGTAGVSTSSQAVRGAYDWIGIDADTVAYQHPWAIVKEGKKVWDYLKQIGDALIARYIYVDRSGVLRFKSNMNTPIGSSLGVLPKASGIGSSVQSDVANKVKTAGVYINKQKNISTVWQVEASGIESENADGVHFERTMLAGDTFPTAAESPDGIKAKYGDTYVGE